MPHFPSPHERSLDLDVQHDSAWTDSSSLVELAEDGTEVEVPYKVDTSCFVTGQVKSENNTVTSLSLCDGVSGIVHTPDVDYVIETSEIQKRDYENGNELVLNVRIVDKEVKDDNMDLLLKAMEIDEKNIFKDLQEDESDINKELSALRTSELEDKEDPFDLEVDELDPEAETIQKRQMLKGAVEVGVFLDNNFMKYMEEIGKTKKKDVVNYMITKWNIVRQVYADKNKVGSDFKVELKYIELWKKKNPDYYEPHQNSEDMGKHLKPFCFNVNKDDLDHKVVYTHYVGGGIMGLSWVGGVCSEHFKCSLVKINTYKLEYSRIEMHELGHNLGFPHFESMNNCGSVPGFMSGARSYNFGPCFKPILRNTIATKSCLSEKNFKGKVKNKGD